MPTSIDIASNALILIGDNPINSFDDDGGGATAASALYPETKKRLLSEHHWSFALKQQQLNRLSQAPDPMTNYQYAFQLPTDMIRLLRIQDKNFYIIVGDLLYSNNSKLLATYIYDVPETNLPPHFVKSLEYALASDLSISVTEDNSMMQIMDAKYRTSINQAMAIDSQNRPQFPIQSSPIINARLGGRGVSS